MLQAAEETAIGSTRFSMHGKYVEKTIKHFKSARE